jgi:hypothetical protein
MPVQDREAALPSIFPRQILRIHSIKQNRISNSATGAAIPIKTPFMPLLAERRGGCLANHCPGGEASHEKQSAGRQARDTRLWITQIMFLGRHTLQE